MQTKIPTDIVYLHPRYGNTFPQITYTIKSGWQIAQESLIFGRFVGMFYQKRKDAILNWNEICQLELKTLAVTGAELISIARESLAGWFKADEDYCKDQKSNNNISTDLLIDGIGIVQMLVLQTPNSIEKAQKWISEVKSFLPANDSAASVEETASFDFKRPLNEIHTLELNRAIRNRDTVTAFNALHYLLIR